MPVEIITLQDLHDFERRLLASIQQLIFQIPPPAEDKSWLRPEEVMKQLNISSRTLRRMSKDGTLKCARIGRTPYYDYRYVRLLLHHRAQEQANAANTPIH